MKRQATLVVTYDTDDLGWQPDVHWWRDRLLWGVLTRTPIGAPPTLMGRTQVTVVDDRLAP